MKFKVGLLLSLLTLSLHAQIPVIPNGAPTNNLPNVTTNNAPITQAGETIIQDIIGAMPTNWAVAPYVTYAPKAPTHIGGGLLALYNFNQNIGAGVGIDWLGNLSMPSCNLQLSIPIHPLTFLGSSAFLTNFLVTPFGLGGIAVPIGGAGSDNGTVAGIAGGGAAVDIVSFGRFTLGAAGAVVNWTGAGAYDGAHYEGALVLRTGF